MHTLIVGQSSMGKTTLAKALVARARADGYATLVFDPKLEKGWNSDYITNDWREFVEMYETSQNCRVFIDECQLIGGREETKWLVSTGTIGRHFGHLNYYIGQRAKFVDRSVRSQCSRLISFRQGTEDADDLAATYVCRELKNLYDLEPGEYLYVQGKNCTRGKIF